MVLVDLVLLLVVLVVTYQVEVMVMVVKVETMALVDGLVVVQVAAQHLFFVFQVLA
jgi:hypothetical protein